MSRNIVICCDGTSNEFGTENTSVVRLAQSLQRDPALQRLYYDPGVGTLEEPGSVTAVGKWFSRVVQMAFGIGINQNVMEAYTYLMDFWEPGDKVYLFGFSRGAYTVRVLAGMLHALGLLPKGNYNLVPYMMRLYKSIRPTCFKSKNRRANYFKLCNEFRQTFARISGPGRRFAIHFLGVWDTVSSYGWIYSPTTFPFTERNPSITVIRHAISIDERRAFFRQNRMEPEPASQDFKQYWFAGVHADVGGAYPEKEGDAWKAPFEWMIREASHVGLRVDEKRLGKLFGNAVPPALPFAKQLHNSLRWYWWWAEFLPKYNYYSWCRLRWNLFRRRAILAGEDIHRSAVMQVQEGQYKPGNFSENFFAVCKGLTTQDALPYAP
jgi:uncharacterized protein (DUF2235 family)